MREKIMSLGHDNITAGHFGITKTQEKIKSKFFWPNMSKDIELHVRACPICNLAKSASRKNQAPLKIFTSGAPMEKCHIDILGPLPTTKRGNVYVLVAVDQFTKWLEAVALPDQKAKLVAKALVDQFFLAD